MARTQDYRQLLEISREIGLPVKRILDVLFCLKTGEAIENNDLIRRVGVSRNVINQLKEKLGARLQPRSDKTQIKEALLDFMEEYALEESLLNIRPDKILGSFLKRRPVAKREYDQFLATPETVSRRTGLLNFLGDVRGKKILFLGDDDFTSVAVAGLNLAHQVTVLDIDQRILETIGQISTEKELEIKTMAGDVRKPLPPEVIKGFDVVFTDPPYTPEGVSLFLSRGIEALDPENLAARIYFCYGNSDRAKERFLPIYESIFKNGLMVRYVFDKFNRYVGAESIGSASSLFVTEVTSKTKAGISGKYDKPIYTNN